ncbi:TetR/AcrR family transcriptional regulator [Nocardioides xinjiangensis]|uniref:TetR/AcrR family transcriptional regulator n=1 Tax=Nocardioides xinjiangensis TaxID=2817376 RepID=UPI001B305E97|nr:TetR/AcrR family transcriptional regulator [Nocardioides sp. SYSU D00778]
MRILDAVVELASRTLMSQITLDDVARAAGVTVQTVLRRFGNREALLDAAHEHGVRTVVQERRAPVGDVRAAVEVVVDHYEHRGDSVVLMLAQEGTDTRVAGMVQRGREVHREWVIECLGSLVESTSDREAVLDLLAVATDVLTWKQLRRDLGLDRATTADRMEALVRAVLHAQPPHARPGVAAARTGELLDDPVEA